jgi:hypothetical protein
MGRSDTSHRNNLPQTQNEQTTPSSDEHRTSKQRHPLTNFSVRALRTVITIIFAFGQTDVNLFVRNLGSSLVSQGSGEGAGSGIV